MAAPLKRSREIDIPPTDIAEPPQKKARLKHWTAEIQSEFVWNKLHTTEKGTDLAAHQVVKIKEDPYDIEEIIEESELESYEIDFKLEAVFKGLSAIPLSEVRLIPDKEAFELKLAKEWDRIETQRLQFDSNPSLKDTAEIFFKNAISPLINTKPFPNLKSDDDVFVSLEGTRHRNEDRYCHFDIPICYLDNLNTARCFALFDGHGGSEAADFCKANAKEYLGICLENLNEVGDDYEIANSLIMAFVRLDTAFREHPLDIPLEMTTRPGCTACLALVVEEKLFVATSGDCRAIFYTENANETKQLTYDFKASDEYAQKSVHSRQGEVTLVETTYRVESSLAITRAIGDEHLRRKEDGIKVVTPRPKVFVLNLSQLKDRKHGLLFLCTDGLTDVTTTQKIIDTFDSFRDSKKKPKQMAERMVKAASKAGSTDDITVGIVDLKELLKDH